MTYYEALGINEDATQEQIKAAYYAAAKKYHPDINDAPNATAIFRLIQEAYETLSNPTSRKAYDDSVSVTGVVTDTESPADGTDVPEEGERESSNYAYIINEKPTMQSPSDMGRNLPICDSIITVLFTTYCIFSITRTHLAISILIALGITFLLAVAFHTHIGWWIVSIIYSLFWSAMAGGIAFAFSHSDWIWFWCVFGVAFLISMSVHRYRLDT